MAHAKQRPSGRWTAIYHGYDGKEKSAGTYDSEATAFKVATAKEQFMRGGGSDPQRLATMTIAEYAPDWLRRHQGNIEPSTRGNYSTILHSRIIPHFGKVRIAELRREMVRSYIAVMIEEAASVSSQRLFRSVFSAMMQTACDDGYRQDNPVRGIPVQRGYAKKITVLRTDQFGEVYKALPSDGARALARLIAMTGCRFGEAACLLVSDLDFDKGIVTFDKALQDVGREFHPDGKSRFYVAPYTKSHDERRVHVDVKTMTQLTEWITSQDLDPSDLLFPRSKVISARRRGRRPRIILTQEVLAGLGEFVGPNGANYQHGTMNGYVTGKCRCDFCTQGFADYRYGLNQRNRAAGKTGSWTRTQEKASSSDRFYDDSDFMSDDRWGAVWNKACQLAGLSFTPSAYQLRHSHASWLINQGEDPKTVMARLGHSQLSTTNRYVHSVEDDQSAADIMENLDIAW